MHVCGRGFMWTSQENHGSWSFVLSFGKANWDDEGNVIQTPEWKVYQLFINLYYGRKPNTPSKSYYSNPASQSNVKFYCELAPVLSSVVPLAS